MANERIKDNMSAEEIVLVMGGGNPGALTACVEIMMKGVGVDPDSWCGPLGTILALDTLGIYEERIYLLYNDVCKRDVGMTMAVLRAYQLGQLAGVNEAALNHAIDNRGAGLDLEAVVNAVRQKLPNFDPEAAAV